MPANGPGAPQGGGSASGAAGAGESRVTNPVGRGANGDPGQSPGKVFAVTTRSRLRGPWLFPHMMIASIRVRRQLKRDDRVIGWASIVAGPSEFWTITVWSSRHDMHEFMRSGAHDDIMWLFSKWLRSFWLMRWRPGPTEVGEWKGMHLAQEEPVDPAEGNGKRTALLEQALEHLPKLRNIMGADGSISYESTPYARRRRAEVGSAGGGVVHIHTDAQRTPEAFLALRRLRREIAGSEGLLRSVVGVSRPGDVYLLSVWADRAGVRSVMQSPAMAELRRKWPGLWANEWIPENEFGHWDGLRLRRAKSKYTINVPQVALEVAEPTTPGDVELPQG